MPIAPSGTALAQTTDLCTAPRCSRVAGRNAGSGLPDVVRFGSVLDFHVLQKRLVYDVEMEVFISAGRIAVVVVVVVAVLVVVVIVVVAVVEGDDFVVVVVVGGGVLVNFHLQCMAW